MACADLSPAMITALRLAGTGKLVRLDGGFWVGRSLVHPIDCIEVWDGAEATIDTNTVYALKSRGLVESNEADQPTSIDSSQYWWGSQVLTVEGRRLLGSME